MTSPHVPQQESKSHQKEDNKFKKYVNTQVYPLSGCTYLDYPYLLQFDLLSLMGVEMPPLHKNGYQSNCGYWRDRHLNGIPIPPPSMVLPFYHSPNMVSNTQMKRNYWNNKDHQRDERPGRESIHEGSNNSDSGFSSPVPSKHHIVGLADNAVKDDSSEDSFHSTVSENGKGTKRVYNYRNSRGNGMNNALHYYYHNNHQHEPSSHHPHMHYSHSYGKRRHHSGRHSPPGHTSQNSSRSQTHQQQYNKTSHNCRTTQSQGDLSLSHGNNRQYGRRLFVPHHYSSPHHIPPDRFLARAHLVQVTKVPSQLSNGGEWSKLSHHIYNKFLSNQQTSDTFKRKIILWRNLFIFIRTNFPKFRLFLVGSTMSLFGSNDSDVDMCLLVRDTEMDQRIEALSHLSQVSKYLRHCDFVDRFELIQAKVPILKFQGLGLEVDLNCNNSVGIRNTHLLYCYSQMDWRVRPLVLIVKLWAARQDINDAKKMTISSYSLSLMVIHYLQCGVNPSVLPCLHDMYKDKFRPHSDVNQIDLHEELNPFQSSNKQALGELLIGFLGYYSQFDYSTSAISVRRASKILIEDCRRAKSFKNDPHQWKYLCIEEPFDFTNTARSVYDPIAFERIKKVFSESYRRLKKTRCLDSIFERRFHRCD